VGIPNFQGLLINAIDYTIKSTVLNRLKFSRGNFSVSGKISFHWSIQLWHGNIMQATSWRMISAVSLVFRLFRITFNRQCVKLHNAVSGVNCELTQWKKSVLEFFLDKTNCVRSRFWKGNRVIGTQDKGKKERERFRTPDREMSGDGLETQCRYDSSVTIQIMIN